jgi:hypothetical protein
MLLAVPGSLFAATYLNIHLTLPPNTQLSGVVSWRADCECNMRDGLLRPSGEATTSTACYASMLASSFKHRLFVRIF